MREYKKPFDIAEALALVDEHMGGSQPMKRLLELLAANYPDVPMPYVSWDLRMADGDRYRRRTTLCFVSYHAPCGVYVEPMEVVGFYVLEEGCYVGRFSSEDKAAGALVERLSTPDPRRGFVRCPNQPDLPRKR